MSTLKANSDMFVPNSEDSVRYSAKVREMERLTNEVRHSYYDLIETFRNLDVFVTEGSGSFRILALIAVDGPCTVPQLQKKLRCSRQYAHRKSNALIEVGFLEALPNPAHKSSNILALTEPGRIEHSKRRDRYMNAFASIEDEFNGEELLQAYKVLNRFRKALVKNQ